MGETVQSLVGQSPGGGGSIGIIVMFVAMFAVMYFLMIRPERKKQSEAQSMLGALKRGDEVVLTSGIIGKIHSIEEKTVVLEIADKTRIKVLKVAVTGLSSKFLASPPAPAAEAKKLEEKTEDKSA